MNVLMYLWKAVTVGAGSFFWMTCVCGQSDFVQLPRMLLPADAGNTYQVLAVDLNGDGNLDLVYANQGPDRLMFGDGRGNFSDVTATHLPAGHGANNLSLSVVAVDVDRDGDLDLVFACASMLALQNLLFLNDGTGHFVDATATHLPLDVEADNSVVSADFNGDGWPDLAFGRFVNSVVWGRNRVLLNDGTGKFYGIPEPGFDLPEVMQYVTGDFDRDGDIDIIGTFQWQLYAYKNDGAGHFTDVSAAVLPTTVGYPRRVALCDIDGDGNLDIVTGGGSFRALTVLKNDGTGHFVDVTASSVLCPFTAIGVAAIVPIDMDGDGDVDLVLTPGGLGTYPPTCFPKFVLFLNDGSGKFTLQTQAEPGDPPGGYCVTVADFDRDGDLDVLAGNSAMWGPTESLFFSLKRQLYSPLAPQIGKNYPVVVSSFAGQTLGQVFLAAGPADLQLPPFGRLGIDPISMVALPASTLSDSGFTTWNLAVPSSLALVGGEVHLQALVLDPSQPPGLALTNAFRDVVLR